MKNKNPINQSRILFVDPMSPNGHINFNNIYIENLYKIYDSIDFSFKYGYEKNLEIKSSAKLYPIPNKYYRNSKNRIINRLRLVKIYLYIKKHCKIEQYDYIIFSSYEEISLYFSFFKKELILVNHNNLSGLNNKIKLLFFKKIAKKNINIVFENYMKQYLHSLGITQRIYTIHHGLPKPFDKERITNPSVIKKFSYFINYKYIIFSPSTSSSDGLFFKELVDDEKFISFLSENQILLIIKHKDIYSSCKNIKTINYFLNDSEYKFIFQKSDIILISYWRSFTYRISAVLFECMINNKLCLISNTFSLTYFRDYFKYDPVFNSIEELTRKTSFLITHYSRSDILYKDLHKLNPSFEVFFSKISRNELIS